MKKFSPVLFAALVVAWVVPSVAQAQCGSAFAFRGSALAVASPCSSSFAFTTGLGSQVVVAPSFAPSGFLFVPQTSFAFSSPVIVGGGFNSGFAFNTGFNRGFAFAGGRQRVAGAGIGISGRGAVAGGGRRGSQAVASGGGSVAISERRGLFGGLRSRNIAVSGGGNVAISGRR
jgi:hypothetical protein